MTQYSSSFRLHPSSLLFLAGTTRLELANQLIEGQPAFHFAFIPETFAITISSWLRLEPMPKKTPGVPMKIGLLAFLLCVACAAVTSGQQVRIGSIEYFGTKQVAVEKVKSSLPVHEGDMLEFDKFPDLIPELRNAVKIAIGHEATDVATGCCDANGNWFIYIGLPGKNVQSFHPSPAPRGTIQFPSEIEKLYQQFLDLNMEAVKAHAIEDRTKGYALSTYPSLRTNQLAVREYATRNLLLIRKVLSESAAPEQRRVAAHFLGYTNYSRVQIELLVKASRDQDETVRNNAVRALGVLAESNPAIAQQIPARDFIFMLNSGNWSDRNKGCYLLSTLTIPRDPKVLQLIRKLASDSLVEMAHWRDYNHAHTSRVLLGRIAGIEEKKLQQLAHDDGDAIILAFKSAR